MCHNCTKYSMQLARILVYLDVIDDEETLSTPDHFAHMRIPNPSNKTEINKHHVQRVRVCELRGNKNKRFNKHIIAKRKRHKSTKPTERGVVLKQ
jgi:hypothetical protein